VQNRSEQTINLNGGKLIIFEQFLSVEEADELFQLLRHNEGENLWQQDQVFVGTKKQPIAEPRLTRLLGSEDGLIYRYSGKTMVAKKWPEQLVKVKARMEEFCEHPLNVVLCNWYSGGDHHVSWHSDNEEDLVPNSCICDLSLGATRTLQFKQKSESELARRQDEIRRKIKQGEPVTDAENLILTHSRGDPSTKLEFELSHGKLLIMAGQTQTYWRHRVPKVKSFVGPRICLTFRNVKGNM